MTQTPTLPIQRQGDGPPVVLVHGAAPADTWGDLPHLLSQAHAVIMYARRGFPPANDHPLAPSLRVHTEDLADIVQTTGPATVVGWSSGGVIALDLALLRPELVRRLVLIEPPLHAKRHPSLGQLRAVAGAVLRGHRDPESGARRFLQWALARRDERPADLARIDPEALRAAAPAIINELTHATGEAEISRTGLRQLRPPTSWLVGTASAAGAGRLAARASKRSTRISVDTVAGAGHAIALDAPERIVAAVEALEVGDIAVRTGGQHEDPGATG